MISTYVLRLDFNRALDWDTIFKNISSERMARIESAKQEADKYRLAGSELLARYVINAELDMKPSEIHFGTEASGKPFLKDHPNFHFNLSHSGAFVVCATGPSPVGIDIQEKRAHSMGVARRIFTAEQMDRLTEIDDIEAQRDLFYEYWTQMEALKKCQGLSLFSNLDTPSPILYHTYTIHPDYTLTLCAKSDSKFANTPRLVHLEWI
jgi:4'-phosphopantetheinyl transferase